VGHGQDDLFARRIEDAGDRGRISVEPLLDVHLRTIHADMLMEVAGGVHEPDGDERHAEV